MKLPDVREHYCHKKDKDTIEKKIVRLQQKKSRFADIFISNNNARKDLDIQHILNIIG